MKLNDIITSVQGQPITAEDVLVYLKTTGTFRETIYKLIEFAVVNTKLDELGVRIPEKDRDAWLERKRTMGGLQDNANFVRYCRWYGITEEQWKTSTIQELHREWLSQHVVDEATIHLAYEQDKENYATVSLSCIAVSGEQKAKEVLSKITSKQQTFEDLARESILDEKTRPYGGYLGAVRKGMLPAEMDREIFAAKVGDIVGPFRQGTYWRICRIDSCGQTDLTDALRRYIRDRLFKDWLRHQVSIAKV